MLLYTPQHPPIAWSYARYCTKLHLVTRQKSLFEFIISQSHIFPLPDHCLLICICSHQAEALPLRLIDTNFTFFSSKTSQYLNTHLIVFIQSTNSSWLRLPWKLNPDGVLLFVLKTSWIGSAPLQSTKMILKMRLSFLGSITTIGRSLQSTESVNTAICFLNSSISSLWCGFTLFRPNGSFTSSSSPKLAAKVLPRPPFQPLPS